jgi:hypothetical protein
MKPFFGRKAQLPAAPESLFAQRPFQWNCGAPSPGQAVIINSNRLPFQRNKTQKLVLALSEAPALTLTADEASSIHVAASQGDNWVLDLCVQGEGNTEAEALSQLEQVSMERLGNTISLNNAPGSKPRMRPTLVNVDAPATATLVVYASFASVQVDNMTAAVRVVAMHARATIWIRRDRWMPPGSWWTLQARKGA